MKDGGKSIDSHSGLPTFDHSRSVLRVAKASRPLPAILPPASNSQPRIVQCGANGAVFNGVQHPAAGGTKRPFGRPCVVPVTATDHNPPGLAPSGKRDRITVSAAVVWCHD